MFSAAEDQHVRRHANADSLTVPSASNTAYSSDSQENARSPIFGAPRRTMRGTGSCSRRTRSAIKTACPGARFRSVVAKERVVLDPLQQCRNFTLEPAQRERRIRDDAHFVGMSILRRWSRNAISRMPRSVSGRHGFKLELSARRARRAPARLGDDDGRESHLAQERLARRVADRGHGVAVSAGSNVRRGAPVAVMVAAPSDVFIVLGTEAHDLPARALGLRARPAVDDQFLPAALERGRRDLGHARGDFDAPEAPAVSERERADRQKPVRQDHPLEVDAAVERHVAERAHLRPDDDALQALRLAERAVADLDDVDA